jgi:Rod binding domain-containing protein
MAAQSHPAVGSLAAAALAGTPQATTLKGAPARGDKLRAAAEDFEAVFLNSLLQQMFANVGQGPFGGGPAAGVWRSMLTDQYARTFAKAGGIGIADHVQRALLAQQEIR